MVSRRYYYILVLRILLIAASCFLFFYFIYAHRNYSLVIASALLFLYLIADLVRYLNRINRKLENFFMIFLSGEVNTLAHRQGKPDELRPLYDYFAKINDKLEKARTENELRNNYFKLILEQTAVGLISFTEDGSVDFCNDAAKRIFGVHVIRNLDRLDKVREGISGTLMKMRSNEQKLVSFVVEGELSQLAIKKVFFKAGEDTYHLVSFQNIKPELDENEIESWQKLIRVLTHEIMNSMTPIATLVNTISRQFKRKEDGTPRKPEEITVHAIEKTLKGLELIESRGQGLVHFVQNYKDVTRIPRPEFRKLNLRELFQRIFLLFEEQLRETGVILQIDCNPSVFIDADGKLLEQVLINLVKNSIEAMEEASNPVINLTGYTSNTQTVIEVCDNGKGIPEDLLENIFVPFYTTKEKGSGIGLSLSRQIIRLHGGTMNVQSELGKKTCFTIRL